MISITKKFIFFNLFWALLPAQDDPFALDSALTDSLSQSLANTIIAADMNNDNINDLVLFGYDETRFGAYLDIYSGTEQGSISSSYEEHHNSYPDTIAEFIGGLGSIDLSDINRDGWLDAFFHFPVFTDIRLNVDGNLTESGSIESFSLSYGSAKWGDVDLDGDPDLFIMAVDEHQDIILNSLQLNDNNIFTEMPGTVFPDLFTGNCEWADYDNDGDPDLIIAGQTADPNSSVTRLYLNDPVGRLIENTSQELIGLKGAAFRFVDLDGDGDLDLVMSGWNKFDGLTSKIYINEPLGSFSPALSQIEFGVAYGSIDAIDFDLDGLKDLVIAGADSVSNYAADVHSLSCRVYKNNGDLTFSEIKLIPGGRTARFANINQDSLPDLVVNGTTGIGNPDSTFCRVYTNTIEETNESPSPPLALTAFAVSTRSIFTWGSGTDDHDDPVSLSYNLRIGTSPGGNDLLSSAIPVHNTNIGARLLREFVEIFHGYYYWSVQTVDAAGQRSAWSQEDTLFIPRLVQSDQSLPGVYFSTAGWGDYNEDGNMDLALTGITFSGGSLTNLFLNDQSLLTQDLAQNIKAVYGGHLSMVDYTNDGHLDLSLSGFQTINFQGFPATYFYKWDDGVYVLDNQDNVTYDFYGYTMGYNGGSNNHSWGDYDNDGDLDLTIGGADFYGSRHLKVFRNDNGVLVLDTSQTDLKPIYPAIVKWSDVNRDGNLDLVTIGADSTDILATRVYLNQSNSFLSFSGSWYQFYIDVTAGAVSFADYNNDGYEDFAVTGKNASGELITYIIENAINQYVIANVLDGVFYGKPDWGDYDNDGDLDLIISGFSDVNVSSPTSIVYRQDDGSFTEDTSLDLDDVGFSFSDWGDYDGDGDLDLFLAGFKANQDVVAKVYENLEGIKNQNQPPDSPSGLSFNLDTDKKNQGHLTWDPPIDLINPLGGSTEQSGLRYQLQVGNEEYVQYPDFYIAANEHGIITGNYANGNIGTTNLTIRGIVDLPENHYNWRVRTIDHGNATSDWSSWHSFYIDITPPAIHADSISVNYLSPKQAIIIARFEEYFDMDPGISPRVQVTHPEILNLDTIIVQEQTYIQREWSGALTLPDDYRGRAIQIHFSNATDNRGNKMERISFYKTPSTIISQYGGTSLSSDGMVSILLPQNSVESDVSLTIENMAFTGSFGDSTVLLTDLYSISPSSLDLLKPAILRMAYSTETLSDSTAIPFIARIEQEGLIYLGGTETTIQGQPYLQLQANQLGIFGIFTSSDSINTDSLDTERLACQPRIFSPSGSVFEFPNTYILFDLDKEEKVTARVFNLAGRLKRTLKPEQTLLKGSNSIIWNGKDENDDVVVSGLYIVTLEKESGDLRTTVGVLNR